MATTKTVRVEDLRDFLINNGLVKKGQTVDEHASLLEGGIIDSLAIIEITAHIERTYAVRVDEKDLVPENFDSLAAMKSYIEKKVATEDDSA
jgi:acyl carrier protein